MKLSVACNFDEALLDALEPYPVAELYGKLTSDYFGGGRPSFYLPTVGRRELARFVEQARRRKIGFNYLLNASAMGNHEFTRIGQREIRKLIDWLEAIGVVSVTVASVFLLRLIKKQYPRLRVRISAHRFTDTPRKVRFWVENGADCIVVSEVNIHRELNVLRALRQAAGGVDLQLIVNNWCRQDCAIAGSHAVGLSAASRSNNRGFPLDYCSIVCNELRLREPVNYIRANWIRPEDLSLYEELGFHNFKIVERNTPTPVLAKRVKAYAERRYEGNFLDLVQNYAYPEQSFGTHAKEAYSPTRLLKYFVKPRAINLIEFRKVMRFGKAASVLYPLRGPNPVTIDNRALDGFIDRFRTQGCQEIDCDSCRYCHEWAERVVRIDPAWRQQMGDIYGELLQSVDGGAMWDTHLTTLRRTATNLLRRP